MAASQNFAPIKETPRSDMILRFSGAAWLPDTCVDQLDLTGYHEMNGPVHFPCEGHHHPNTYDKVCEI